VVATLSAALFTLRPATTDDYAAFVRLCPELGTGDPIPPAGVWASTIAPTTLVATLADRVVAYCHFQEYDDTGYVRALVVDPAIRRQGAGRILLTAVVDRLRARGKTSWRLNVKPDNVAAIALYSSLGLRPNYLAKSFRLPWSGFHRLPSFGAVVKTLASERDAAVEDCFSLPRGQLTVSRRLGRVLFEAVARGDEASLGLAVFNPSFPGAFPFRVVDPRVARDLLDAMRLLVPNDHSVNLVAEDDERLAALLLQAGAVLNLEILHMTGAL
jgi:ribosomal protein S18 acetylase RimI-like enzyme